MNKRIFKAGCLLLVVFLFLSIGCGDKGDGIDDDEDNGENVFPGNTIEFQGDGGYDTSGPFYSDGCEVELSITHADFSRFLMFIIDKSNGSAYKTIVYTTSITDEKRIISLPRGDYFLDVETSGAWSVSITGCVVKYLNPNDYETDPGAYVGCGIGCCTDNGGVFGCDCNTGYCICHDNSQSEACNCECENWD